MTETINSLDGMAMRKNVKLIHLSIGLTFKMVNDAKQCTIANKSVADRSISSAPLRFGTWQVTSQPFLNAQIILDDNRVLLLVVCSWRPLCFLRSLHN